MSAFLESVDQNSRNGRRNYALVLFLHDTGARVQEVADVTIADLRLETPYQVKLTGKGRNERLCPLWPETVTSLQNYLNDRERYAPEVPVFLNANGKPITRLGFVTSRASTPPKRQKSVLRWNPKRSGPTRFDTQRRLTYFSREMISVSLRTGSGTPTSIQLTAMSRSI